MSTPDDQGLHLPEGATTFFLAVVLGISLIGFVSGTSAEDYDFDAPLHVDAHDDDGHPDAAVPSAPTYTDLRHQPRGTSSGFADDLETLAMVGIAPGGSKSEALAAREARRSFDGAPPRIPHPVRQDSAPECLVCHQDGLTIRGRHASPMAHAELASCTQCHVVENAPMPGGDGLPDDPRAVANSFVGMASPVQGPRSWSIAPPQVPHKTFMRERCEACHGEAGKSGLQSSHPWRDSCEQCHAAPAGVDQRPGVPRSP